MLKRPACRWLPYGFGVYVEAKPVMVGHNGVDDGQTGDLLIVDENQAMIVALSNVTPHAKRVSWPSYL